MKAMLLILLLGLISFAFGQDIIINVDVDVNQHVNQPSCSDCEGDVESANEGDDGSSSQELIPSPPPWDNCTYGHVARKWYCLVDWLNLNWTEAFVYCPSIAVPDIYGPAELAVFEDLDDMHLAISISLGSWVGAQTWPWLPITPKWWWVNSWDPVLDPFWAFNQPANGQGDCAILSSPMEPGFLHGMINMFCDQEKSFICEYPAL